MKKAILKILNANTHTEGRYIGGGDEPQIIVFTNSDDCEKEKFLSQIADDIIKEISMKLMNIGESLPEKD